MCFEKIINPELFSQFVVKHLPLSFNRLFIRTLSLFLEFMKTTFVQLLLMQCNVPL